MKSKDTGHVDTTSRDTRTRRGNSRDTGLCLENSWDNGHDNTILGIQEYGEREKIRDT